jgi:hypothetical protein
MKRLTTKKGNVNLLALEVALGDGLSVIIFNVNKKFEELKYNALPSVS